jgi:DNA (cytosine-5)-methyltransferase 1
MGYHRAGFEVVGVDIEPQPHYPFEFHQGDAMTWPLEGFDAIHASPPCQDHSVSIAMWKAHGTGWMLPETLERLKGGSVPWVVENVVGLGVKMDGWWATFCGTAFGLNSRRHRRFGSSMMLLPPPCRHVDFPLALGCMGHSEQGGVFRKWRELAGRTPRHADRQMAMGIDWMTRDEMAQAIPPAYTEFIGTQLLRCLSH